MRNITIALLTCVLLFTQACVSEHEREKLDSLAAKTDSSVVAKTRQDSSNLQVDSNVVWASNIGGSEYQGADGIRYLADEFASNSSRGEIDSIKGVQDATIYQTYRTGDIHLKQSLPNGMYDIVFRFAEPSEVGIGGRVFDVLAQGQVVISGLDVRSARDGNAKSGVDRAVLNIEVSDGVLDVQFNASVGQPLLNAIVVRAKQGSDPDQWDMVWGDDFNYEGAPNIDKWNHDIWPARKVNDEDQKYTADAKNVRVSNGKLVLEAHMADGKFTSGRIHSAGKGDIQYGRVEVRAKLPKGQGTWPAIWMLPSDPFMYASSCDKSVEWQGNNDCDAWPNSGEIDIMEHVGYDENRVHGTVHTKAYYWVNGEQRKASIEVPMATEEFHVYAMEWSPERIDVFLDDVLYFTYLKQSDEWQAWPFDHPFHLILNLAVGGGWGSAGGPTDLTAFPTRMEVDYVRMYKRK